MRFEREAKAVSGISHPNIAHIYATGRFEGRPYFVMEFIAGRSLGRILEEEGRIPGRRCLDYLRQAAEGLAEAHARGVIHRDVKPDNLMVDADDRLKVVDFGLAKRVEGDVSLTQADMVVGTPRYMSPEQATGGVADHRSDIYSLGATFYHLFAGQAPFDAPTPVAVLMKHVHDPLVPLHERVPQIPAGVSAIIDRMMEKEPAHRYQRYQDLIADVKRALSGAAPRVVASTVSLPPTPRPAPPSERPTRLWIPIGALAVALGIVVFLAFRAGSEWKQVVSPASKRDNPASDPRATDEPGRPTFVREPGGPGRPPIGLSGPQITGYVTQAFKAQTIAAMKKITTMLKVYMTQNEEGGLPSSLDELVGDRWDLRRQELLDGWKTPLRYERTSKDKFRLTSAGPDRAFDTEDDIVSDDGFIVKGNEELDPRRMEEQIRKMRGE